MYSTNLVKTLNDKINAATNSEEVHYLSEAIRKLNIGAVKTVSTYANMTALYARHGDVVFVEDEGALYFSSYGEWWLRIFDSGGPIVYAWGSNVSGSLGDGTAATKSSPVLLTGGITDWVQMSSGSGHSLGLRYDGTAWSWGSNVAGKLGNVSTTSRSSPGLVAGNFNDWIFVAAGRNHSLGIRKNRTLWSWGNNQYGQLGDGTAVMKSSPVSVVGGFTDWTQATGGYSMTLALRSNGTAWAWGAGSVGQKGDGTFSNRSSPVSVVGGFTDWTQLSAGGGHGVGLRSNGTLWTWGYGLQGQLGDGPPSTRNSPVSVVGGFTNWTSVEAGARHSIAIRSDGTAWSWGQNDSGQLGDNSTANKSSPVSVVGGFTDWVQVSGGQFHSHGIRADGTAWSWGNNSSGRLGNNSSVTRSSPVAVAGSFVDWVQVSAGFEHSLITRIA